MNQTNYYQSSEAHVSGCQSSSKSMRQIITATVMGMRLASLCLVIYWIVIFVGTHLPRVPMPSFHSADKLCHFVAFAGLSLLLAWALPKSPIRQFQHIVFAFLIAAGYGIFDEMTQALVRGRSTEVLDFAADCAGAVVGLVCYCVLRRAIILRAQDRSIPDSAALSRWV